MAKIYFFHSCVIPAMTLSAHVQDLGLKNKYYLRYTNYKTKDEKQEVSFALNDTEVPNTSL